jgi:hypothetical protein
MRFRRIYWVTEQLGAGDKSVVTGVYTSVHDLLEHGLAMRDFVEFKDGIRLTLVELDSAGKPILSASSPDFAEMQEGLKPLAQSGELTAEECARLVAALTAGK